MDTFLQRHKTRKSYNDLGYLNSTRRIKEIKLIANIILKQRKLQVVMALLVNSIKPLK